MGRLTPQVNCTQRWYGNQYGGFYLNPDLVPKQGIVYSFGIGEDISFDREVIARHGCTVHGFDPTPKSIAWCAGHSLPANFTLHPFGIARATGTARFLLPKNPDHVSGSVVAHKNLDASSAIEVPMKSFPDIVQQLGHSRIDVLKMDIEGTEYAVMDSILQQGVAITQLAVELHERFFRDGRKRTAQLIRSMNIHGYKVFAVSDSGHEVSFVREASLR